MNEQVNEAEHPALCICSVAVISECINMICAPLFTYQSQIFIHFYQAFEYRELFACHIGANMFFQQIWFVSYFQTGGRHWAHKCVISCYICVLKGAWKKGGMKKREER